MALELNPAQRLFRQKVGGAATHILNYGGARGGKTFGALHTICLRAIAAPGSRHMVGRFRYNAVKRSVRLDTFPKVMRLAFPGVPWKSHDQDGYVTIGDGAEIWFAGLDSPERIDKILGMEFVTILLNEVSEIPYGTVATVRTRLAQSVMVPALGRALRPKMLYDLNPVGSKHWSYQEFIRKVDPSTGLPLTNADDFDVLTTRPQDNAANLADGFIANLENLPALQRKRFLDGVYNTEVDGALWTSASWRRVLTPPRLVRVVVAVDPSGAKSAKDLSADEIGIIVVGLGDDGKGYVLADLSLRAGPTLWARVVVNAYKRFQADAVVVESNYGGPMAEALIRNVDGSIRVVNRSASRGKHIRAEPVAGLYERGQVVHVGPTEDFSELEDQLGQFTVLGWMGAGSPDRADALVWAVNELMIDKQQVGTARVASAW